MAEKRALSRTKENPRGYYDRELTKNARDLKEVFDFGLEPFPDLPSDHPKNRLPVDGHNQWPAALRAFKAPMPPTPRGGNSRQEFRELRFR